LTENDGNGKTLTLILESKEKSDTPKKGVSHKHNQNPVLLDSGVD